MGPHSWGGRRKGLPSDSWLRTLGYSGTPHPTTPRGLLWLRSKVPPKASCVWKALGHGALSSSRVHHG